MATLTANQVGSSADYLRYTYDAIQKTEEVNNPTLLDFKLVASDPDFVKLKRGAYITLTTNTYGVWFTGFVTNDAELDFLGTTNVAGVSSPKFGYVYEATSDEYLLNLRPIGIVPPFVNTTQGAVLKYLVNILTPAGWEFDVSGIADGQSVTRYVIDPTLKFSEVVKVFSDLSNYQFTAQSKKLVYTPQDVAQAGIAVDGTSQHFTPSRLQLRPVTDPVVNDAIILGDVAPQTYFNEYFIGDGATASFSLANSAWGVDSSVLLDDDFSSSTIDNTKWTLVDEANAFIQPLNGFLNLLGGNNDGAFDVYLQGVSLLPLEGNLRLTHGEYDFVSASDGIIASLWSQDCSATLTNCIYGLRATKSGSNTVLKPIVNGVVDVSQSFTIDYTKRYNMRTLFGCDQVARLTPEYSFRSADGTIGTYGGTSKVTTAHFQTVITAIDPTSGDITGQTTFENDNVVLTDAQTYAYYCPVVSNDLHLTVTGVTISSPMQTSLEIESKGAGAYTRKLMGPNEIDSFDGLAPVATIVDSVGGVTARSTVLGKHIFNTGQATLTFFKDTTRQVAQTPQVGDLIHLTYRVPGAALGRVQDSSSMTLEADAFKDDGMRTIVMNSLSPLPRTDEECEQAAAAYVATYAYQHYEGTYEMPSGPWFSYEPHAGTILKFQNMTDVEGFPPALQAEAVTEVVTTLDGNLPRGAQNNLKSPPIGVAHMFSSAPLANHTWNLDYSGFTSPTLPGDAVISGIYPVAVADFVGGHVAASLGVAGGPSIRGLGFGSFSGEFNGSSIGTSLAALASKTISGQLLATLSIGPFDDVLTLWGVGFAVIYTSASSLRPSVSDTMPPPFPLSGGQSLAWSLPTFASGHPDSGSPGATNGSAVIGDVLFPFYIRTEVFDHTLTFGPLNPLAKLLGKLKSTQDVFIIQDTAEIPDYVDIASVGLSKSIDITEPTLTSWDTNNLYFDSNAQLPQSTSIQMAALVGAFTNSSGAVIRPIYVGLGGTFTVPTGATQLQLGVSDDKFSDNAGSWSITVNGSSATIPAKTMPWLHTGGLNAAYSFGIQDGTSPVVIPVTVGASISIAYVSGTITIGPTLGSANASGYLGIDGSGTGSTRTYFPGHYTYGPSNTKLEVRYSDDSWGAIDAGNLVTRVELGTAFTVPRNTRGKVCYIRAYDTRNVFPWSDDLASMTLKSDSSAATLTKITEADPEDHSTLIDLFTPTVPNPFVTWVSGLTASGLNGCWSISVLGAVSSTITLTLYFIHTDLTTVDPRTFTTTVTCNGGWQRVSIPFSWDATFDGAVYYKVASSGPAQLCHASTEIGTTHETVFCKTNGAAYGALSRYSAGIRVEFPLIPPAPTGTVTYPADLSNAIITITDPTVMIDVWGYEIRGSDNITVLSHVDLAESSYSPVVTLPNNGRTSQFFLYSYNLLGEYSTGTSLTATVSAPIISSLTVNDHNKALTWNVAYPGSPAVQPPGVSFLIETDGTSNTFTHILSTTTTNATSFVLPDTDFFFHRFIRVTPNDQIGTGTPVVVEHTYTPVAVSAYGTGEVFTVDAPPSPGADPTIPAGLPPAFGSDYIDKSQTVYTQNTVPN